MLAVVIQNESLCIQTESLRAMRTASLRADESFVSVGWLAPCAGSLNRPLALSAQGTNRTTPRRCRADSPCREPVTWSPLAALRVLTFTPSASFRQSRTRPLCGSLKQSRRFENWRVDCASMPGILAIIPTTHWLRPTALRTRLSHRGNLCGALSGLNVRDRAARRGEARSTPETRGRLPAVRHSSGVLR
jgi:hypothetical protein